MLVRDSIGREPQGIAGPSRRPTFDARILAFLEPLVNSPRGNIPSHFSSGIPAFFLITPLGERPPLLAYLVCKDALDAPPHSLQGRRVFP